MCYVRVLRGQRGPSSLKHAMSAASRPLLAQSSPLPWPGIIGHQPTTRPSHHASRHKSFSLPWDTHMTTSLRAADQTTSLHTTGPPDPPLQHRSSSRHNQSSIIGSRPPPPQQQSPEAPTLSFLSLVGTTSDTLPLGTVAYAWEWKWWLWWWW